MVPTPRLWAALAAGIPFAAWGVWSGAPLLGAAYDVLLLGGAWASGRFGPDPGSLKVERRMDPLLSVRRPNRVTLKLTNTGAEPLKGVLRDEPPLESECQGEEFGFALAPGESVERVVTVTPRRRGTLRFRGTFARLDCPLGLVRREARPDPGADARVYPDLLAVRSFDFMDEAGRRKEAGLRRSRERGQGTEFESLRDYEEGDDYRRIDFAASARGAKLVVRQFEPERSQNVIIALDTGRAMLAEVGGVGKLDHALDAALLLASAVAREGDAGGLLVYDEAVRRWLPPRKGREALSAAIAAGHDLDADLAESDPVAALSYLDGRWKRRSLLVLFTDVDDDVRARELAAALAPLRRRHLVLVVRVDDPALGEARRLDPDSPRRQAVELLDADRRTSAAVLAAAGLRTVTAEPERLPAVLVSVYRRIKARGEL